MSAHGPDPVGWRNCEACGRQVMNAWDGEMTLIALEADPDKGTVAVSLDGNGLPWCRSAVGVQLELDENLYRPHDPWCEGLKDRVRVIGSARSAVARSKSDTTERRRANA